jgi:hypothetical protein
MGVEGGKPMQSAVSRRWRIAASLAAAALAASACGGPKTDGAARSAGSLDATAEGTDGESALPAIAPVDYAQPEAWLCRPGAQDACATAPVSTSIAADGARKTTTYAAAADPPIDCFYVYPTVSLDATPNSDIIAGSEEQEVVRQQLARFGSVCRLYAPMYRQVTLPALRAMLRGESPATNREMAYADVKAAWAQYLVNDNGGRGVVLIGHSQGAGLLTRLIASEIDGKPVQDKLLVSALLIGANLSIADPHLGGGSFTEISPCVSAEDIGCAIAYSSFRADAPPPADSLFGKAPEAGMRAACVNPAELDGSGGVLKAMLPAGKAVESMAEPAPWTRDGVAVETPFVELPGLLTAACVSKGGFDYLAVTVNADPEDARTDTISGDVVVDGVVQPAWGLHLIDMNLAMGNLVAIVKRQGESFASREASRAQHPQDDK